ncbi:MAG: hypothetical protein JSU95_08640 [Betaproteobacteria bacterium]|nr:MAG: hypothetical protein JSU95_08640 [Betaproteobacteria bacterium]
MRDNNEGGVNVESLESLTKAVRQAYRTIEEARPGCFDYNSISLRGALEIGLYWRVFTDPRGKAVVNKGRSDQMDLVAEFPFLGSARGRLGSAFAVCKAWALLTYHAVFGFVLERRSRRRFRPVEFLFCVIHPRFIDFFLPVIDKLGRDRCALLCEGDAQTASVAARHGLAVCSPGYARLRMGAVGRPPVSVFWQYSAAVVQFLKAVGTLQHYRASAVVFAEGVSSQEAIIARAARSIGILTVRLQHGRAGVLNPAYYDMPFDKVLMWGEGFIERLRRTSPGCKYIVTGAPLMDGAIGHSGDNVLPLHFRAGPVVTIISQPQGLNISRQDYETIVNIADRVLHATPNLNVLVRMHPVDSAEDFGELAERWNGRLQVTRAQDYPLAAVLAVSTIVVGLYSTVLSEAVAFGVLPVVIRLRPGHRVFPSPEESGAAVLASSPDDAVSAICELAIDRTKRELYADKMADFTRAYFGPMDGRAVERIAFHIENSGA